MDDLAALGADLSDVRRLLLVGAPSGDITFPFTFPLVATGEGVTDLLAPIGGTRSTWLTVEFHGPVINPSVEVGDLHIGIYGTLAYDEVITIDPRPWVRTAISSITGGSVAGLLDKSTPQMRDMTVEPGNQVIRFRGRDDSGTAGVTLRWRNARSRP